MNLLRLFFLSIRVVVVVRHRQIGRVGRLNDSNWQAINISKLTKLIETLKNLVIPSSSNPLSPRWRRRR